MLIENYRLEIFTPPCDPGAERYSAVAHLNDDIAAILPYLNAVLSGANYIPSARALTWKRAGHLVAFHADRVAVSNVEDREEAIRELDRMVDLVNRTWDRKAEVVPVHEPRKRAAPMVVYNLLPRTNCGECGEATCMAFAFALIQGKHLPADCTALPAEQQKALQALLT